MSKDKKNVNYSLIPLEDKKLVSTFTSKDQDAFASYIKDISKYPVLSIEEEQKFAKILKETGDIDAAKKLVVHNLKLVVKIAMDYKSNWQNMMDLIQEGNIGLMKAVSLYDSSKGAKLSYYASWWIRSYILKYILDNFRLVKIGTTNDQKKLFYNLYKEKNRLIAKGIDPDVKTISENLGVSEKSVVVMEKRLASTGGEVSLDTPISGKDGSSSTTLESLIEDDNLGPEDIVENNMDISLLKTHLSDFVDGLKERDKEIFQKRLLNEVPLSLQAIANDYGVSRERIRQIESRLMDNLKTYMKDFIN